MGFVLMFTVGGFSGVVLANGSQPIIRKSTLLNIIHWSKYDFFPSTFLRFTRNANMTFFPQHFLGLQGTPIRINDYPDAFAK